MRPFLIATAAMALSLTAMAPARAQGLDNVAAILATAEEHLGQSVGEAALGGSSVYVTAQGTAKLASPLGKPYVVSVQGQAATATGAAQIREAKIDKLRAAAKRFGVEMTVEDASYSLGVGPIAPRVVPPPTPGVPPLPVPPVAPAKLPQMFTTTVSVRFTRPSEAQMPGLLDAIHEAGVETLASTALPPNPLAQVNQFFGIGGPAASAIAPEIWDKASVAAVEAARREAQVLAAAGGRKLGPLRGVMLLTRTSQGDQVTVSVGARFGLE